jgi:hypothetical protein
MVSRSQSVKAITASMAIFWASIGALLIDENPASIRLTLHG